VAPWLDQDCVGSTTVWAARHWQLVVVCKTLGLNHTNAICLLVLVLLFMLMLFRQDLYGAKPPRVDNTGALKDL
jgi:hypothetical protein